MFKFMMSQAKFAAFVGLGDAEIVSMGGAFHHVLFQNIGLTDMSLQIMVKGEIEMRRVNIEASLPRVALVQCEANGEFEECRITQHGESGGAVMSANNGKVKLSKCVTLI